MGEGLLRNHPKGRNPGDVLNVALKPSSEAHFATMPVSLAHRLLKATLPTAGVALDPFNGAGSTGVAARLLGGKYFGIDLNAEYLELSCSSRISGRAAIATQGCRDEKILEPLGMISPPLEPLGRAPQPR